MRNYEPPPESEIRLLDQPSGPDVSGHGVWVGNLVIGSGKGIKIGDDVIVRVASRRRNKVKLQILVKRPGIEFETDASIELEIDDVELEVPSGDPIPTD